MKTAIKSGHTFIDTAEFCEKAAQIGWLSTATEQEGGGSETRVGKVLSSDPEPKKAAFVATKISKGPYTKENIRKACRDSLAKLQRDSQDLFQLHKWDLKGADVDSQSRWGLWSSFARRASSDTSG